MVDEDCFRGQIPDHHARGKAGLLTGDPGLLGSSSGHHPGYDDPGGREPVDENGNVPGIEDLGAVYNEDEGNRHSAAETPVFRRDLRVQKWYPGGHKRAVHAFRYDLNNTGMTLMYHEGQGCS